MSENETVPTFQQRVRDLVGEIPDGLVTTYGDIARALGEPKRAREVGWALAKVPQDSELPCHRVVDREGALSGGWSFGSPEVMRSRLVADGVPFLASGAVDLQACRWEIRVDQHLAAANEMDDLEDVSG